MNPVSFPEHTMVYAKDQPQYRPLPAHRSSEPEGRVTFCWNLSWRERLAVLLTGNIWHQVLTFHAPLQPQLLTVEKPAMRMPQHLSTDETAKILGARTHFKVANTFEALQHWLRRKNRAPDVDQDDPPACPHCGAMAGACDQYPNCPMGKEGKSNG